MKMMKLAAVLAAGAIASAAAAQEDRPEVTVAVPGIFRTMEPIDGNSTDASRILPNIFDQIVTRNFTEDPEGGELRPALATSWERVDELTWRFTIREGVTFHNGDAMTAEDVAFSIGEARVWGEDALVPVGRRYTESFDSVEAIDDTTVQVTTTIPDPSLPSRFITPLGFVVPMDHYLEVGPEAFGQNPIGTGPYRLVEYDAASHIRLEAFDEYWGGTPPFSAVEFRAVPEYSGRVAGLVADEFQLIVDIPADEVETVEGYEGVEVVSGVLGNYVMFGYNTLNIEGYPPNPVADVNLRYAMTAAIDREALVQALWGDETFAPTPFNFPDFPEYYDPEIEPLIGYDPDAAAEYLAASDYDGEEFLVNVTRGAFPNFDLAAEFMVEQWNAMGINARLNFVDSWSQALQHPFGLVNFSMTTTFDGSPTRAIWGFWGPDSARATRENDRSWSPPEEFVSLGEQYLAAPSLEERRSLFREMVAIWEREQPALMLWRRTATWANSEDLDWTPTSSVWLMFGPGYASME